MLQLPKVFVFLLLIIISIFKCSFFQLREVRYDKEHKRTGIVYSYGFKSVIGTRIPIEPGEQIPKEEALKWGKYCVGIYNDSGQVISGEIYENNILFSKCEYEYYPNRYLKMSKCFNGIDIIITQYDEKGNFIQ